MRFISRINLPILISVIVLLLSFAPATALVDQYICVYETGTDFGEAVEFGYDLDRNSILLQKHWAGAGYNRDFTIGNVSQEDGRLLFDFELWNNGSVAMRESLSLNFETLNLDAAQYLYDENGEFARDGQTAVGGCYKVANTVGTPSMAVIQTGSDGVGMSPPSPDDQGSESDATIICHTEINDAEGPKSATYCVKSQLPAQKEHTYGPQNLAQADGAWCEGEPGQGIGVGIEVSFRPHTDDGPPPEFDRLLISNGYDRTADTFMENSRVKSIEIRSDDGVSEQTFVRTLRDEAGVQEVFLGDKIRPYGILMSIVDGYPGQKYQDTCLSYVSANFGF